MAAALKVPFLPCFILVLAFSIPCESASHNGFTVELVHRDSPRSPYYDPADTPYHRMAKAIRRSISRVDGLDPNSVANPSTPSGVLISGRGDYLMNITLGTPPVNIVGVADTGSDLIWTRCKPCTDCFNRSRPPFDPHKSSTYKNVSCSASQCKMVEKTYCGWRGLCKYFYPYVGKSNTSGNLATETFSIGSTTGRPVSFPRVLFGCGHKNRGTFDDQMDGIIGLGGGAASLISQMGRSTGRKFSYCLVPFFSDRGSKLNFGANAVVTGRGTVSTPLVQKDPETHYYLTLEAVSVGKTRVDFPSDGASLSGKEGNIVIDSGSTLTRLPHDFYYAIEAAMVKYVKLPRVSTPPRFSTRLCYKAASVAGHGVPPVTFHFKGADVVLRPTNSFFSAANDTICFTLAPGEPSIYGNLVQMDFLVGYDIQNKKLSFKPVNCTFH